MGYDSSRHVAPVLYAACVNGSVPTPVAADTNTNLSREQTEQMAKHKVLTDSLKQYEGMGMCLMKPVCQDYEDCCRSIGVK